MNSARSRGGSSAMLTCAWTGASSSELTRQMMRCSHQLNCSILKPPQRPLRDGFAGACRDHAGTRPQWYFQWCDSHTRSDSTVDVGTVIVHGRGREDLITPAIMLMISLVASSVSASATRFGLHQHRRGRNIRQLFIHAYLDPPLPYTGKFNAAQEVARSHTENIRHRHRLHFCYLKLLPKLRVCADYGLFVDLGLHGRRSSSGFPFNYWVLRLHFLEPLLRRWRFVRPAVLPDDEGSVVVVSLFIASTKIRLLRRKKYGTARLRGSNPR